MALCQLGSNRITFMIKKLGVNLHCYIATRHEAEQSFNQICDLLKELGLPINQNKLTSPTKCLTVLSTEIDIQANTM